MTVHVYQSTDPGAPVHPSSTRGSMAALLRACLVTGWTAGDTVVQPAGWEEPYAEANNKACFRAKTGARQFFQIDESETISGDGKIAVMTAYESMSDAENGLGSWGSVNFGKLYNVSTALKWAVIADERTCYVLMDGYDSNHYPHGFGEFISTVPDDPYNSFISGHSDSRALYYPSSSPFVITPVMSSIGAMASYVHRSIGGVASVLGSISMGSACAGNRSPTYGFAAVDTDVDWYALPLIVKALSDVGASGGRIRGKFRGVLQPLVNLVVDYEYVDLGGMSCFCVKTHGGIDNSYGQLLFDSGDWE